MRTIQEIDKEYSMVSAMLGDAMAKGSHYGKLCQEFGERSVALLQEAQTVRETPAAEPTKLEAVPTPEAAPHVDPVA